MSSLRIDYNFATSKYIDCGIDDIEEYKNNVKRGLSELIKLTQAGEVGFPKLTTFNFDEVKKFSKSITGKFNDLIVVGIGGSSLGFEAIANALLPYGHNSLSFAERGGYPRVWIADNVDPHKSYWIAKNCLPQDTLLCVITKSGTTVETISNFLYLYNWMKEDVNDINEHIVVVTDNNDNPLRKYAVERGIKTFDIPSNVGGRYSVLSVVGMLPSFIVGLDIDAFLEGAKKIVESNYEQVLCLAAIYSYYIDKKYNINVMMPYTTRLKGFSNWFCQLWAESLGKKYDLGNNVVNFGTTPYSSVGANDQHSLVQLFKEGPKDKLTTFIEVDNHDLDIDIKDSLIEDFNFLKDKKLGSLINIELKATEVSLRSEDKPTIKLVLENIDESSLGQLFMLYQYVVAVIGLTYNINPFDQPGVEEGKQYTYALMGRKGFDEKKSEFERKYIKDDEFII
ncbi:MAG: glucose-6-phosphate isomerase [Deferribacterota bacterium]|nr:glucose-6-phosphate isomerase [Deferribacterota bacterium]